MLRPIVEYPLACDVTSAGILSGMEQTGGAVIRPTIRYFRTGDFAARAGVSVRTIRYYDRVGLLKPSAYSESGQRLYTESDYARLQQILTLKLLGLSLAEIGQTLTTDAAAIPRMLDRQQRALREQALRLLRVVDMIEAAQRSLRASPQLNLDAFINIIQAVMMAQQSNWLDQFIPAEHQTRLAEHSAAGSLDDQRRAGQAWQKLFQDIHTHRNTDVRQPEAQALVARWDELLLTAAPDDAATGVSEAYAHLASAPDADRFPPELREWLRQLQTAAAFIQQARAAGHTAP